MKNKRYLIIGLVIITGIFLFSYNIYNDNREKGLNDVISYDIKNFESLIFNEGVGQFEWRTDKEEHAEKLIDFLSRYRVKKMKDYEWDSNVSNEEGFQVTIYSKGKPIMASIYEHRVHYYNDGDYYKVVNGPIDVGYIEKFQQ